MNVIKATPGSPVMLGKAGEKNVTRVLFDCTSLVQKYGAGEAELTVQLPNDTKEYVAGTKFSGNVLTWDVGPEWTQKSGYGKCQLFWFVGGALAKSDIYTTCVKEGMSGGKGMPSAEPGYTESVRLAGKSAAAAEASARSAEKDANRAEAALGKGPYIGENGNWFVWNAAAGAYVDTGRFSGGNAPYIGANGNWFIGTEDSGVSATGPVGPSGPQGPAYKLTPADKAEIVAATLAALPKAEEAEF